MKPVRRLLVLTPQTYYGRQILQGIHAYCRTHGLWEYHVEEDQDIEVVKRVRAAIKNWQADGIIAQVRNRHIERVIVQSGLPAVNVSGYYETKIPSVVSDDFAIGRLVARHLIENGGRNFAYCAMTHQPAPRERCRGFVRELAKAGFDCEIFTDRFTGVLDKHWVRNRNLRHEWVRSLQKPVAIMCTHDPHGMDMSWACKRAGIKIPEEVALVGVGGDEALCNMCSPPLSSIKTDVHAIGHEAARLVHKMLRGISIRVGTRVRISPIGLSARQSSDMLAINDPEVADTIRLIRQRVHEPLSVKEVLEDVMLSRRAVERRFKKIVGRTLKQEIMRHKIARAQELLTQSILSIADIAAQTGFAGQDKFAIAFRRECGTTPTAYRRASRPDGSAR